MKKWKCLKTELILDSKYMKVRKDLVELPSGEKKEWTYWDSPDSSLVVGMTEEKKLVMVRQYRYMSDEIGLEFPAGYLEGNESMEEAARREFEEEAGYSCSSLVLLGSFYETIGQLNRRIHIFFAKDIVKTKQTLDQQDKGYEDIEVLLVDYDKVISLALENRKMIDISSVSAILLLKEKIDNKEIIL